MSDTLDLAPPQRAPVLRTNPSGRSVGDGAEQSWWGASWGITPFEDGAEQSLVLLSYLPFEDGAEQSVAWWDFADPVPFEDGA